MFTDAIANFLVQHLGVVVYLVMAFSLILGGPVLFLIALRRASDHERHSRFAGLLLGLAVAAWTSLCWLAIPYCGGYPSLLGGVAAMWVFQSPPIDTLREELLLHGVNFAIWPLLGWAVFYLDGLHIEKRIKASATPPDHS